MLNRTALGHYTFALGSNAEAVRLSGVNVDAWKIAVYGLGGAICGIAGILIASRLNSAQPALGQGYELEAIAAVVIGGTSLSGGTGTILGTIIGAFIMSVRKSTCSLEIGLQNGETHHDPRVVREPLISNSLSSGLTIRTRRRLGTLGSPGSARRSYTPQGPCWLQSQLTRGLV